MGVKGLWRLLLPIGRRISIETLEGQILAIDASIWLTQFLTVAARQREQDLLDDDAGNVHGNSNSGTRTRKAYSYDYLVGFLRRLCKLRYQGVRPVLVFDGETPEIKRREIAERLKRRKRKLGGDSFLGPTPGNDEETEAWREATRRMAKRILAKQLRSGTLMTKAQKQRQKQKQAQKQVQPSHKRPKILGSNAAAVPTHISRTSYAPGFYDPDAKRNTDSTTASQKPQQHQHQQHGGSANDDSNEDNGTYRMNNDSSRDNDNDDHLLRDDYNSNRLLEEVNDWDAAIVIHSDDEGNGNDNGNGNDSGNDDDDSDKSNPDQPKRHSYPRTKTGRTKKQKQQEYWDVSKFHAGDGTGFAVDSVADLPETARKDVIEDAQKQRRMASRREFLTVASDPDRLSTCQLRNFLKSTRLNRDIAHMAQKATAKAEEEAKMVRGNGILFEKESTNTSTNPASKPKTTHTALGFGGGGRRQHYRAHEAKRNRQTSTKTGSTTRTMRMFHHQKGSQHGTTNNDNDNDNDNDNSDDEHDFHKVRNAHYLTGGIRFVDSDEHEHKHKHKHDASESHRKEEQQSSVAAGATLEDGGGGFAVPIADGSNAWTRTCTGSEEDGGEVICIDNDSDNFSDDDSDSHDSGGGGYNTTGREESFLERHNQRNSISVAESETRTASRAEQESQDHALARALQSIEDEANDNDDDDDDDGNRTPRECIEIDDCSDEDDDCGGGFLSKSPTSRDEAPSDTVVDASRSRDRSQLELDKAQVQEEDDAKLARELQQSEYEEEHKHEPEGCWGDGGGGFLPSTTDHEIEREDGGTSISQANPSKRAGIPSEDDNQKPTLPHEGLRESDPFAGCNSIFAASQQVSAAQTYKDPFAADNSIFGASQQASAAQTHKGELLTCPLTSEDDGDEDDDDDGNVDWEEGDGGGFVTAETSRSNSESSPSLAPQLDKTEGFTSRQPGAAPTTNGELLTCPLSSDEDDEDVDWEDGNDQDKSEEPKTKTNHLPALTSISKHREGLPSSNSSVDDGDGRGRVDWEDGKIQIETMERKTIQPSKDAREKLLFCHSSSNKEDGNQENDGSDGNNVIIWEDDKNNDCNEFDGKKRSSHHETVELSGGSREKEFGVHGSDNDNDNGDDDEQEDGNSKSRPPRDPEVANVLHAKMYANKLLPVASFKINDHDRTQITKSIGADETGNEDDDEDDDDAVDWEDGDGECEKEVIELSEDEQPVELPGMVSVSVVTDGRYGGKGDCPDDCEGRKDTLYFAEAVRGTSGKPQTVSLNEGKQQETSHTHKQSSKYFDNVAGASMAAEVIDIDDDDDDDDDEIDWEAGTTEDALAPIGADDWGTTKTKSSNEVAAALEHAQGTAANLTNWAGRAFRRAIAQHAAENGMEIPESAKPGVLKTKTNDVDEDCLVPSKGKSSVQSESKKPHPSKRKTSDDTIDNSDWLNALDTTNTQGQDFTTAPREAIQSDQMMDPTNSGVTEEMRTEVMQLLRLFGIPYVVAPAEAEAQCVELEKLGLVDGIVTEDSDTFVFGGQVIYKNIFEDKKYVEVYHAKDASEEMNLNQDALVALAMLLGADYTEGVKGVGIVNGMEILQAFDVADDCKAGLTRFRKWLDGFDPLDLAGNNKSVGDITGISTDREQLFHRKHHTARTRWVAPKHFPDIKVLNAYLNPVVDTSRERFSWGVPDLDGLIAFCHGHMGWTADETKKLILPIVQRMEEGSMRQTRIDSFMRYEDGIKFAKIQSKRLRTVLGLSSMETDDRQPRRRNKIDAALKESVCEHKETESDSFNESEEGFASVDLARNQDMMEDNEAPRCEWKKKDNDTQPQPKPQPRRYNGKRTRSLAALSTASASTTAIAVGCTNIAPSNTSIDDPSMSITRHRIVNTNVPKTAPPAYQAHSSTILEEANSNTASSQDCNQKGSSQIYEVINPSMI